MFRNTKNKNSTIIKHQLKTKKGVLLITAALYSTIITGLTVSIFANTINERRVVEMNNNRIIAFQLAEAGIDSSIAALRTNPSYTGTNAAIALGGGQYSVAVTTPDPSGNPNVRQILATGYAPDNQASSYAYQERIISTFISVVDQPLYTNALFAYDLVKLTGNAGTDSYNSALGSYDPNNAGANGNIASNTTNSGKVQITGNVAVNGDITVGPVADPSTVIDIIGNVIVTGNQLAAASTQTYDPATVPAGLESSGNLLVTGNNQTTLAGGTYWFESIDISGNGQITADGPVTIYVTDDVSIAGNGFVTNENKPANMIVNVVGDQDVSLSGNADFYGVIYAPESDAVSLTGNTDFFGAIICDEFEGKGNVKIHYDESLTELAGESKDIQLISWNET